ncbi:hypothetical protein HYPSUDRAFT_38791 [Hypholoma sublateritium FD-334 SS-4]|uniref:Uncharacterized protein n=1 Tax=Hypholoma sublateritium (strain FD-334 SS-4) TaxID=945553 RepID=A0A0D2MKS1_HYPSF|nr:hypothetical protein HYPSUDRAFT_38791 [Hypholoma sublateritium FD-334 SS-4]
METRRCAANGCGAAPKFRLGRMTKYNETFRPHGTSENGKPSGQKPPIPVPLPRFDGF